VRTNEKKMTTNIMQSYTNIGNGWTNGDSTRSTAILATSFDFAVKEKPREKEKANKMGS
jgi:prophage tail gpP-like protein